MKLSIIIATFNSGKDISNALESVLNLSIHDWECIVVDGASKDNTIAQVKEFADKDTRFRYISEPDRGIYDAFNKGWRLAKGNWIYYLGSDDRLLPDGLPKLMAEAGNADVVYGRVYTSSHNGRRFLPAGKKRDSFRGYMANHQSMIMRRNVILECDGFDDSYNLCADYDLVQKLACKGKVFKFVDTFVAIFCSEGATGSSDLNIKESYIIEKKYGFLSDKEIEKRKRNAYLVNFIRKKIKYPIMEILLLLFPTRFQK